MQVVCQRLGSSSPLGKSKEKNSPLQQRRIYNSPNLNKTDYSPSHMSSSENMACRSKRQSSSTHFIVSSRHCKNICSNGPTHMPDNIVELVQQLWWPWVSRGIITCPDKHSAILQKQADPVGWTTSCSTEKPTLIAPTATLPNHGSNMNPRCVYMHFCSTQQKGLFSYYS